mmetsp:Transcript_30249/g.87182  ORF Transcript_30249/g.87182 Transcript_30249/m.87182 type:complete len:297 (+) Transcript_30249:1246-2136(+)
MASTAAIASASSAVVPPLPASADRNLLSEEPEVTPAAAATGVASPKAPPGYRGLLPSAGASSAAARRCAADSSSTCRCICWVHSFKFLFSRRKRSSSCCASRSRFAYWSRSSANSCSKPELLRCNSAYSRLYRWSSSATLRFSDLITAISASMRPRIATSSFIWFRYTSSSVLERWSVSPIFSTTSSAWLFNCSRSVATSRSKLALAACKRADSEPPGGGVAVPGDPAAWARSTAFMRTSSRALRALSFSVCSSCSPKRCSAICCARNASSKRLSATCCAATASCFACFSSLATSM